MSKLNLTFRFATSRQNVSDKFPMVESFIKQFINEWFSGSLISEEIQVVLTDSIKKTNEELDNNSEPNDDPDSLLGCVYYIGDKIYLLLWIDYYLLFALPEVSDINTDFGQKIKLDAKQVLYHEMQHIKNKFDYPTLMELPKKVITSSSEYLQYLPYHFLDEYIATVSSQSKFYTLSIDSLKEGFNKIYPSFHEKYVAKKVDVYEIKKIVYWCSHLFALREVTSSSNEDIKGIETYLGEVEINLKEFIEKRFFLNLKKEITVFNNEKDIHISAMKIGRILSNFYSLAHRENRNNRIID